MYKMRKICLQKNLFKIQFGNKLKEQTDFIVNWKTEKKFGIPMYTDLL